MTGEQRAVHSSLVLKGTNEQGKYDMYSQVGRAEAYVLLSVSERNKRAGKVRTAMTGE